MQLNNFYERALWNEWNQLKRDFQKRSIRQLYYPQYMDTYYQFESKLSVMQRQQISNAKQYYHQLGHLHLTNDQIDSIISEVDYFGNKKINYTEFIVATLDV